MVLVLRDFLPNDKVVWCRECKTHLSSPEVLMSREFQGLSGRAYLYEWTINVKESRDIERNLTTGTHVIREISCMRCNKKVGWKYISTNEETQMYKVGRSILERAYVEDANNELKDAWTELM